MSAALPRATAAVLRPFWLGFLAGLLLGGAEGVQVMRSNAHIFAGVAPVAMAAAVAQAALLAAVLVGLVTAAAAALYRAVKRSPRSLTPARLRWKLPAVVTLLALPLLLFDLPAHSGRTEARGSSPNLVLIVVDALRRDRLGCYGYQRPTSPHLDALCGRSIVYQQAVAQYPATGPSFGSIFTAKYPRRHGLSAMDPRAWIGGRFNRTLAEVLGEQGYRTAAVMAGSITRSSGLGRGFAEVFEEHPFLGMHRVDSAWQSLRGRLRLFRAAVRARHWLDRELVTTEAERWLDGAGPGPFFLFVHLFQPHSPYNPPERLVELFDPDYTGPYRTIGSDLLRRIGAGQVTLTPPDVRRLEALYDAEVRAADEAIGRVLRRLDQNGLREKTVVLVTADHGEDLYEHGVVEHGHIHNTNLLVPLVLSIPGRSVGTTRVSGPVELIDLMPTVLGLLRVPVPSGIDGRPLPLADRSDMDRHAFAEADCDSLVRGLRDCWLSVQTHEWKLDRNKTRGWSRLFDIEADPFELEDVAPRHPEVVVDLERRLEVWDASQPDLRALREGLSDSERAETEKRLRALGYIH